MHEVYKQSGTWSALGSLAGRVASRGGMFSRLATKAAPVFGGLNKASPYLGMYHLAGSIAKPLGVNLPGYQAAGAVGMPGISALGAAPNLIRTARMASGNYDNAIKGDVTQGAQFAGADLMDQFKDPNMIHHPEGFLQQLASAPGAHYTRPPTQYGVWDRLGQAFSDPTQLAIPQVRQEIYNRLQTKQGFSMAAKAFGKVAPMIGRMASKAAPAIENAGARVGGWGSRMGQWGSKVAPVAENLGAAVPKMESAADGLISANVGRWGPRLGHAGAVPAAAGAAEAAAPAAGKWWQGKGWGRAGTAVKMAPLALTAYDGYKAMSDSPYDRERMMQEGYNGAMQGFGQQYSRTNGFQRFALGLDPSMLAGRINTAIPGSMAEWQRANGHPYDPGWLSQITQPNAFAHEPIAA